MRLVLPGVALLLSALPAGAGPKLAVVELAAPETMTALAAEVTRKILQEAVAQGYEVRAPKELQSALGTEGYENLQNCGENLPCVISGVSGLHVDRAVLGSLGRDERSYLLRLWLISVSQKRVLGQVNHPVLIAGQRFTEDVTAVVPNLLRGLKEAHGELRVKSRIKGAHVTVDGEPRGEAPVELKLTPGRHAVTSQKEGFLSTKHYVNVEAEQSVELELDLTEAPRGPAIRPGPR